MAVSRRVGFTLVELLVVIAIIGVLVALLLPAVQMAREAARRTQCLNNMRQVGIGLHMFHDVNGYMPEGWTGPTAEEAPGWGWAAQILPYLEQNTLYERIDRNRAIADPFHDPVRQFVVPTFICPSDAFDKVLWFAEEHHEDDHDHFVDGDDDHDDDHDHDHPPHNIDDGEPFIRVAKSNYVGMFGTFEIHEAPSAGNGSFFHNSRTRFGDVVDGLSNTILVGERSAKLGGSTWLGMIPGANEPMARIVGVADHSPNHIAGHFEDFRSYHPQGANFLMGDGSVHMFGNTIDLRVYFGLSTIHGHEPVSIPR